jgi:membrane-bound ClpP family serine protease
MTAWLALLILGFLLILAEFYLPGAVMGVAGGLMVFASLVLFANQTESLWAIIAYIFIVGMGLVFLVKFALWRIRSAKPDYSIYSNSHQEGFQASHFDASAIGKEGIVLTDLKPGGYIQVEGKEMQAISQSGYLPKGTEVVVISGQEESLIVKIKQGTPK